MTSIKRNRWGVIFDKPTVSKQIEKQLTEGYIFDGYPNLHTDMKALIKKVEALEIQLTTEQATLEKFRLLLGLDMQKGRR